MPLWLLTNWRPLAYAAAAVLLLAVGYRLGGINPKADLRAAEARHAAQVADWHRQSAEAAQAALKRQQALQMAADTAREDLDHARTRIREQDGRIARLSVDSGRLRDELAAYAAGTAGPVSEATCHARAAALADYAARGAELLARGADLSRRAAIGEAERAAEVRALLQAWPKNRAEDH